jgi:hypothetical protein
MPDQPRHWREWIKVDPAADLMPLDEKQLAAIGPQIAEGGIRVPIVLFHYEGTPRPKKAKRTEDIIKALEAGQLWLGDGRSRIEALWRWWRDNPTADSDRYFRIDSLLGDAEIKWNVNTLETVELVDIYNVTGRRHLSPETYGTKRAQLQARIDAAIKAEPERPPSQIARELGVSPSTVGARLEKLIEAGDVSKLETRTDSLGRQQPAAKPRQTTIPGPQSVRQLREAQFADTPSVVGQFRVNTTAPEPERQCVVGQFAADRGSAPASAPAAPAPPPPAAPAVIEVEATVEPACPGYYDENAEDQWCEWAGWHLVRMFSPPFKSSIGSGLVPLVLGGSPETRARVALDFLAAIDVTVEDAALAREARLDLSNPPV